MFQSGGDVSAALLLSGRDKEATQPNSFTRGLLKQRVNSGSHESQELRRWRCAIRPMRCQRTAEINRWEFCGHAPLSWRVSTKIVCPPAICSHPVVSQRDLCIRRRKVFSVIFPSTVIFRVLLAFFGVAV